jgi:hypothetical protein
MTMLDEALKYIAEGYKVFPCCWPDKNHLCGCGRGHTGRDIGKAPITPNGFKDCTQTQLGVKDYWKRWPVSNIGIMPDGFYVLDVDADHGGLESLPKLTVITGLFSTRTIATGGGGFHFYFKGTHGTVSTIEGYPGLEIRGTRVAYVIAPPSMHVSGLRYSLSSNLPISEAPPSFIEIINRQRTLNTKPLSLKTEVYEGENRNVWLTSQQGKLLNSLKDLDLVQATVRTLNQTCCKPPLTEGELQNTLFKSLPKWLVRDTRRAGTIDLGDSVWQ